MGAPKRGLVGMPACRTRITGRIVLTERELDVMAVIWDQGSATVREAQRCLPRRLAYTTVLTLLRILEAKGYVHHTVDGRAHRYWAVVTRADAQRAGVHDLVQTMFAGSVEDLLMHLVSDSALSRSTRRSMRMLLNERLQRASVPPP